MRTYVIAARYGGEASDPATASNADKRYDWRDSDEVTDFGEGGCRGKEGIGATCQRCGAMRVQGLLARTVTYSDRGDDCDASQIRIPATVSLRPSRAKARQAARALSEIQSERRFAHTALHVLFFAFDDETIELCGQDVDGRVRINRARSGVKWLMVEMGER